MQMTARGSLTSLSSLHFIRNCCQTQKGTPRRNWKAIFFKKVEQLPSSYPSYNLSRIEYFFEYRSANLAIASPTAKACTPLQASKMLSTRLRLYSRQSSIYLLSSALRRKRMPASFNSPAIQARKKGKSLPKWPSTENPPIGIDSEWIACAILRKYSASSLVKSDTPSSLIRLNSFFFSQASCYRAEVSCARVLRFAFQLVAGTRPFKQIHCPLNLGSSSAPVPNALNSSQKSAQDDAQVRSTLTICSFLLSQLALSLVSTMSVCEFSLAARATSSAISESRLSLCINFMAVSTSSLVQSQMSVCSKAYCYCGMSRSAACDLTMWSIKLGFVNNVIQYGTGTWIYRAGIHKHTHSHYQDDGDEDQQPTTCQPFFLAQAQMQGQQCFLSESRSFAHLISAITSAPPVSKAFAQATTVRSMSTAHSISNSLLHSALMLKQSINSGWTAG